MGKNDYVTLIKAIVIGWMEIWKDYINMNYQALIETWGFYFVLVGNISLIIWIQAIHKIILNSNSIYKENNNGTPVFTLLSASHWALGFSFVRFTWHVHYSLLQLIPLPHYFVLLVAAVATKRFLSQIFSFK